MKIPKFGISRLVGAEWIVPDEDYIVTRFLFVFTAEYGTCTLRSTDTV
jgi:hypothetical protein